MDDDAVRVLGDEGLGERRGVLVDEAAGEVVLDDEGPGGAGDPDDLPAPLRSEDGARRVLEERLADEDAGPGGAEGGFEELGADSPASVGTGTGRSPEARATASMPG